MIDKINLNLNTLQKALKKALDYESVINLSAEINSPIAPPISASISITSRCNSDCIYCSFRSSLSKNKIDISNEKIKRIIDDLSIIGVRVITFTGGEPLLRTDLSELCKYANSKKMTVHVTTNGLLLTNEIAYELYSSGVSNIIISLDSFDERIYNKHRGVSFKKVSNAIDSLLYFANLDHKNYGVVTYVVSRLNFLELPSFVKSLSKYGNKKLLVNIQPYHKPPVLETIPSKTLENATKEELKIYKSLLDAEKDLSPQESDREKLEKSIYEIINLKQKGFPINNSVFYLKSIPNFLISNQLPEGLNCKAGYSGVYIQENLNMLPCWRLPSIGNLDQYNLTELWFSERYSEVRSKMLNHDCPKCMFLCHNETGWYSWYNIFYKQDD